MTEKVQLTGRRRLSRRAWRIVGLVIVVLLLAGAFLQWGPIGLGNGPLAVQMEAVEGGGSQGPATAFILPMYNSGHAVAVVEAVTLIGGTSFPGPRLLAVETVATAMCGGAWPARTQRHGFVMIGCGGNDRRPLIGQGVPYTGGNSPGYPAAAEVASPGRDSCWVLTTVVVHYHVGIRHYAAADPYDLAVCAPGVAASQVNAAQAAALNASG
jgi:hypothetical protein